MKSSSLAFLLSIFLLAGLAGARAADDFPGAAPVILGNASVRRDLGLTKSQCGQLDQLRSQYKEAARTVTARHPETLTEKKAANSALAQINREFNAKALAVLNPAQTQRLDQIGHQTLGGWMLLIPRIQKSLQLSGKQLGAIEAIRKQGEQFVSGVNKDFEAGTIGLEERLETLRSWRINESKKFLRVLTPAQKKSLSVSQGADFKPA